MRDSLHVFSAAVICYQSERAFLVCYAVSRIPFSSVGYAVHHENCKISFRFLLLSDFLKHSFKVIKLDDRRHHRVWAAAPKSLGDRLLIVEGRRIGRGQRKNNIGLGGPDVVCPSKKSLGIIVSLAMIDPTAFIIADLDRSDRKSVV